MSIDDVSPVTDRQAFAREVKKSSDADLRRLMTGGRRDIVLGEIFTDMPAVFRPDRAGPLSAVVHWRIADAPDGDLDVFELVIAGGACVVSPRPVNAPRLTLTIGAVDFLKMVTGNANATMLFMRGKLKARGDLALTGKLPSLFETPKV